MMSLFQVLQKKSTFKQVSVLYSHEKKNIFIIGAGIAGD